MTAEGSHRAIVAAFLANLGIAVAKFAGFVVTGSASMLAESVHSVADTSNQGLLLLGNRRARREPTDQHPFGYARERYFWAFVVALVIFTLGAIFSLLEGEEKFRHPHEVSSTSVAIVILAVAIVLESLSLRTAVRESRPYRQGQSWRRFVRDSKTAELPVVLLEDVGALLGLIAALTGIGLAELTGNARFDAAGSLVIGVVLALVAVTLMVEMRSLLIGESATPEIQEAIHGAVVGHPLIRRVIHLRTQHLGPEDLFVGVKIEPDPSLDVPGLARVIDEVEMLVRARVPEARVIYVEPDVRRDDPVPAPDAPAPGE